MRYHHKKPNIYYSLYGNTYECNHPIYDNCTLFKIDNKGLAVIQQRFNKTTKSTYWDKIDPWLTDLIYLHDKFEEFFNERAGECNNGLYPTVTVRQIMWEIIIKPVSRKSWETYFDRRLI